MRRALPLAAILIAALVVRIEVALHAFTIVQQDETFQYFEQAHRLVFGSGVVPWEFLDGIRSWLLPGAIAVVMLVVSHVTDDPWAYVFACRVGCIALSVSVVFAGARLVEARAGRMQGLLTAAIGAMWAENLYFAPAVLTDTIAASCAIWAMLAGDEAGGAPTRRRLTMAGALLGLAFSLRFQLAPALLVIAVWQGRTAWRRWRALALGGLAVVLPAAGVLDWITLGSPFQSIWLNFIRNAVDGVSAGFGTEPWTFYIGMVHAAWAPLFLPLLVLMLAGAVRLPALAMAAGAILLAHSVIAHKEYRFIVFALMAAPILCGAGAGVVLDVLARRLTLTSPAPRAVFCIGVATGLAIWSGFSATHGLLSQTWGQSAGYAEAMLRAGRRPALCGVALLDNSQFWSGGYTYLGRDVPLFMPRFANEAGNPSGRFTVLRGGRSIPVVSMAALAADPQAYNAILGAPGQSYPGFTPAGCFANDADQPQACLFERPGPCS